MPRILVIEDNPANLKLATLLLHKAGHVVTSARTAEDGLIAARAEEPDLILMDVQLPGMSGLDATRLLKQDPATQYIPVIAVTALAMKGDEERIRTAGCDGYLAKPLRYQQLWESITALLARRELGNADGSP
ncbi:MAG TPA: response regulator [Paraburkholderia sp.]|jgi:two-component system cell cycle response regulator DivK